MGKEYTAEDLERNDKLFSNRLRTRVLEEFYMSHLISKVYIYILSNGDVIHLMFDDDQFCHLLGLSYFGYKGKYGWNVLKERNILICNLHDIENHMREEIRITNFPKILKILECPTVYLFGNTSMNYKADYFAVWKDGKRYYKLGIGTSANGINYGETYQVSLIKSKDNREIDSKHLLTVCQKCIMQRKIFNHLYYPIYLFIKIRKNLKFFQGSSPLPACETQHFPV